VGPNRAMATNRSRHSVVKQYAQLAGQYETRWSFYVDATTEATLARLPENTGDLLDVGCGTGALLARVPDVRSGVRLSGIDATPAMVERARKRLPKDVFLAAGWAEALPFADGRFDTVVSSSMFHYIRQPALAVSEMLRVLRPEGRLLIVDWCDDYLMCKLCDLYLRWFDPAHYCTYGVRELQALLDVSQVRAVRVERFRISMFWGLMSASGRKG